MTTPNNAPPSPVIPFSITGVAQAAAGDIGNASALAARTEAAIRTLLIETEIFGSTAWNEATAAVYGTLRRGIALIQSAFEGFLQQITGSDATYQTLEAVFGAANVFFATQWESLATIVTQWAVALAEAGVALPIEFVRLLRGLIPAAVPGFNGTAIATTVTGFVDNLNGTISYTVGEAESDVAHLIQQADGTVVTAAQLAHNIAAAASTAGVSAGQAVASGQQVVDHGIAAIEGAAVGVAQSARAYAASMTNMFTNWVNAWSGQSLPSAASPEITAAAEQAAQQAAVQAQQTAAINAQLPHFYGGHGTSGLNASANFTGLTSLPSTFTQVSTIAKASAQYNVSAASSDSQTVSGIWSSSDGYAKYLFLRASSDFTTYDYTKIQSNNPSTGAANCEVGTVVAGVRTVLGTFTLPGAGSLVANSAYAFEATDYAFSVTGPNGLNYSVTDASHVSQVGPLYRWGGFGTDGWVRDAKVFTQPDGAHIGHYSVPVWVTNGTRFDVVVATQGQAYNQASLTVGGDFSLASLGTSVTVDPAGAEFPTPVHSSIINTAYPSTPPIVYNNVLYDYGSSYGYQGITALDLTAPGSMLNWDFYDSGPGAGPAVATVATNEGTGSTTYVDLATTTDQVTVNVGPSGMVIVFISCSCGGSGSTVSPFMGFALSGANTAPASDAQSFGYQQPNASFGGANGGTPILVPNLNQGATTFKAKYRTTSGTSTFSNRSIAAIPL